MQNARSSICTSARNGLVAGGAHCSDAAKSPSRLEQGWGEGLALNNLLGTNSFKSNNKGLLVHGQLRLSELLEHHRWAA